MLENSTIQFLITVLFIWVLTYALLKKTAFIDSKLHSLIALIAAFMVAISGFVSYVLFYIIRLFSIVILPIVLLVLIIVFVGAVFGVSADKLFAFGGNADGAKYIAVVIGIIAGLVFIGGAIVGVISQSDDAFENTELIVDRPESEVIEPEVTYTYNIDNENLSMIYFLVGIGLFVMLMGK